MINKINLRIKNFPNVLNVKKNTTVKFGVHFIKKIQVNASFSNFFFFFFEPWELLATTDVHEDRDVLTFGPWGPPLTGGTILALDLDFLDADGNLRIPSQPSNYLTAFWPEFLSPCLCLCVCVSLSASPGRVVTDPPLYQHRPLSLFVTSLPLHLLRLQLLFHGSLSW